MVQPQQPPLSIRPGEERLARIDAYAAEHKLSRHLAILLMLDEGYRSLTQPKVSFTVERQIAGSELTVVTAAAKPKKLVNRLKGEWKAP